MVEELEIAQYWKHVKLKDVAEKPQYGVTASAAKAGPVKFLRITDITDKGVDWDTVPYCEASPDEIRACLLRDGDIVFARIGATTGKSHLITDPPHAVFASYLIRVRTRKDLDPEFLSHFFKSDGYWEQVNSNKHANLKKGVNGSILSALEVPVPPLREQHQIAHVLNTVQEAIAQQERLIRTTTELKQALMQKLFTEGLHNEALKETEIGMVPESWEVVALRDVCDFQSGGTPSKQRPEYWLGAIPWVSPKDMKRPRLTDVVDHISEEGLEAGSRLAPAGSVLIVIRGMILAKDVPVAIAEVPMAINQDMKAIIPGDRIVADFLLYALIAHKEKLFHKVGRSAHGTMTLMSEEIFSFQVPLPPVEVQQQIAGVIRNMDLKLELHARRRNELKDLFRTLLHELMTGKVRVGATELQAQ